MRRRRPVLGILSGIIFGIFGALSLALWGIVPLDSVALTVVLVLGIGLGIAVGFTTPLARLRGGGAAPAPESPEAPPASEPPSRPPSESPSDSPSGPPST